MTAYKVLTRALAASAALALALGVGPLAFAADGPSVTLTSNVSQTTTDTTIPVTATFSENVNGFGSGSLTLNNASISEFSGSGSTYTFNLHPGTLGALSVSLPAGAVEDASGTPSLASNELDFNYVASGTPAVISNVQASDIAATTATITWNTDQPADSQVFYGETSSYDASSAYDADYVTSHTAYLGGLLPGTLYHFDVASNDGGGVATSSDATFTTTGANGGGGGTTGSTTPLALVSITPIKTAATADGTFADGWSWDFKFSVPNNEPELALQTSDFTGAGTIPAASDVQYYSTESGNATSSANAMTLSAANSFGGNLDFTNDFANSTTSGDTTVDVIVNVAVPTGTPNGNYNASWTAESTSTTP